MKLYRTIGSIVIIVILGMLFLTGCNLPLPDQEAISDWLNRNTPTSVDPTPTEAMTQVGDQTPGSGELCAFMWATQPLPDVTEALQNYFNNAGWTTANVSAEAFGENCVRADGSVARFLTMYTDIRVKLPVERLGDTPVLAEQAEAILRLVLDYPADQLPGSLEGYLGITFVDPQGQVDNLWFKRLVGKEALDRGLSGEEMLLYLRGN